MTMYYVGYWGCIHPIFFQDAAIWENKRTLWGKHLWTKYSQEKVSIRLEKYFKNSSPSEGKRLLVSLGVRVCSLNRAWNITTVWKSHAHLFIPFFSFHFPHPRPMNHPSFFSFCWRMRTPPRRTNCKFFITLALLLLVLERACFRW